MTKKKDWRTDFDPLFNVPELGAKADETLHEQGVLHFRAPDVDEPHGPPTSPTSEQVALDKDKKSEGEEEKSGDESKKQETIDPAVLEHRIGIRTEYCPYQEYLVYLADKNLPQPSFFSIPEMKLNFDEKGKASIEKGQKPNFETYMALIERAAKEHKSKAQIDEMLDVFAAQKYAILQILIKNEEAHWGNILIRQKEEGKIVPIAVDFAYCLAHNLSDPSFIPRTSWWEKWPALTEPLHPNLEKLITSIDHESFTEKVGEQLFEAVGEHLTRERKQLLHIKLQHLQANVMMLQECCRQGLNIRYMLALIVPYIDNGLFLWITQRKLRATNFWIARKRLVSLVPPFRNAWSKCHHWRRLDTDLFAEKIEKEVSIVKEFEPEYLEDEYFGVLSFELRRALHL